MESPEHQHFRGQKNLGHTRTNGLAPVSPYSVQAFIPAGRHGIQYPDIGCSLEVKGEAMYDLLMSSCPWAVASCSIVLYVVLRPGLLVASYFELYFDHDFN